MPALAEAEGPARPRVAGEPSSSPKAVVSSARARGPFGARLITGRTRAARHAVREHVAGRAEQAVEPLHPGQPDDHDEVGGERR